MSTITEIKKLFLEAMKEIEEHELDKMEIEQIKILKKKWEKPNKLTLDDLFQLKHIHAHLNGRFLKEEQYPRYYEYILNCLGFRNRIHVDVLRKSLGI